MERTDYAALGKGEKRFCCVHMRAAPRAFPGPNLVERVPEVVPVYPDRIVPVSPKAAAALKTRTLTNLYDQGPAWLDNTHRDLDAAVAAAYGWPADISQEEALARLPALNLERAAVLRPATLHL
jgi:hypothetical protein